MAPLRRNPPYRALFGSVDNDLSSPDHRSESGVQPLPRRATPGRGRVLFIAPTAAISQYERALVLDCDCDVEVVGDMAQAFQRLVYDREFRMILCPGRTAEGTGTAFLGRLHQLNLAGCPRVVIFDGSEEAREIIEAIQMGVRQYIPGPCPPADLVRKVNRLLGLG